MKIFIALLVCLTTISHTYAQSTAKRSNQFNPAFGLNALFLFQNSNSDIENDGASLQGVELQFSSDVDSLFRAEATIGIHKEEAEEEEDHDEHDEHGHNYQIDPEEVFVETLSLPYLTIKAGKFLVDFGKYNAKHTHNLPFITKSQIQQKVFGDEGYKDVGINVSYLTPLPWFSNLSASILQADNQSLFSESHHSNAYSFKWKNLWDMNEDITLEWSASTLMFKSHGHDESSVINETLIYGSDITLKWRPSSKGKYSSFVWSTEYINKNKEGESIDKNSGFQTFMKFQFSRRWYTQIRYEKTDLTNPNNEKSLDSHAFLLAFVPSEFSSLRLQYESNENSDISKSSDKRFLLQLNISIGAHPAHNY